MKFLWGQNTDLHIEFDLNDPYDVAFLFGPNAKISNMRFDNFGYGLQCEVTHIDHKNKTVTVEPIKSTKNGRSAK